MYVSKRMSRRFAKHSVYIWLFVVVVVFLFSRQCWIVSGDVEFKAVIVRLSSDVGDPRSSFGKFCQQLVKIQSGRLWYPHFIPFLNNHKWWDYVRLKNMNQCCSMINDNPSSTRGRLALGPGLQQIAELGVASCFPNWSLNPRKIERWFINNYVNYV